MNHSILIFMVCSVGLSIAAPRSDVVESADTSSPDSNTDIGIEPLQALPTGDHIFRSSSEAVRPADRDMETANTFWFGRGLWGYPYGGYGGGYGGWGGYGRYGWW